MWMFLSLGYKKQIKMKKRKAIFVSEELHALIKKAAENNHRKITDELLARFCG